MAECLSKTYSNCIYFTVATIEKLAARGYSAQNLDEFLIEIIDKSGGNVTAQLDDLKTALDEVSTKSLPANARTFGLKTGGVEANKLTNRKVDYTLVGQNFSYDLSGLKAELPTGFKLLSATASVVDDAGKRSSVRGTGSTVKAASLPITAKISATIQTPSGQLELEKELHLTGDSSGSSTLNVNDLTAAAADLKQHEFNELVASELALLRQKLG